MTITKIKTEITTLSHSDKLYLLQMLVQEIVKEERVNLQSEKNGQRAAEILRRMADRNALASISDPVQWQREMRQDNEEVASIANMDISKVTAIKNNLLS